MTTPAARMMIDSASASSVIFLPDSYAGLTKRSRTDRAPAGSSIHTILPARVLELGRPATPGHVLVKLAVQGTPLLARITTRASRLLQVDAGRSVWAQVKSVAVMR